MPDPTAPDPRPASMRRRVDFDTSPEPAPERTPPDDTAREIPCPRWSLEETHPAHEWDAPVDGHSKCPGWAAPVAPDDLITVARWAEANGGPGSLIQAAARRLLAAAPVTAEDLRAQLIAQLNSEPYMTPAETVDGVMVVLDRLGVIDHANYRASSHASEHAAAAEDLRTRLHDALTREHYRRARERIEASPEDHCEAFTEVVLAVLAGDPGDLPARMAAELNNHEWEPSQRHTAHRKHNYHGACAICQEDLPRIAAAILSVRWEHAASQAAEVERLRAELAEWRSAAEHADENLEIALQLRASAERERESALRQRAEQAEAERDLLRETLAESDLGAQVLAQWEAISAADADRDRLEAERTALKAAISDVLCRMATTRAWAYRELSGAALSNVQRVIDHLWGILDPDRSIHPALAIPESPENAPTEARE